MADGFRPIQEKAFLWAPYPKNSAPSEYRRSMPIAFGALSSLEIPDADGYTIKHRVLPKQIRQPFLMTWPRQGSVQYRPD
jgi:hypothetical protein